MPQNTYVSKFALVFVENTPLGWIGVGRMYLGCTISALLKFILFMATFLFYENMKQEELFLALPLILGIWIFYDWLTVSLNALSFSREMVYCAPSRRWVNPRDIRYAFLLSVIFSLSILISLLSTVLTILFVGFEKGIDQIRSWLRAERIIPSGAQIKEALTIRRR